MVIWITGLSGAGKSTVAEALWHRFKAAVPELTRVDGDEIRALFGQSLGYRETERHTQITRIQKIALMLDRQELLVVVSALYSHPELLAWNRKNFRGYLEVYLDAPLELVRQRDPKGLYARAAQGKQPDVVGIDVPWHAPQQPDLRIDMASAWTADAVALAIAGRVPSLSRALEAM